MRCEAEYYTPPAGGGGTGIVTRASLMRYRMDA